MSDVRHALQSALGADHTVVREMTGGGMSRVFLADEGTLGRRIVVKLVAGDVAEGVSLERFRREVQVAAALEHPNIVPVLSAGDVGGLPFYTMPFIDGETLRAKLTAGPLPVPDVVSLVRDVAKALVYAHERGFVHRDIKPDNVLLVGGAAVVLDFGIAKALAASSGSRAASETPGLSLTAFGMTMGTPAYMAPEQATGDPRTDHRADLYSLGVTAYEALAGAPPFSGHSHREVMMAHVRDRPESITARRRGVPRALAAIIMRCLEKDPARRPQTARELLEALDSMSSGSRDAVASNASTPPDSAAIAVLPFANLSGDPENEYFADGVTEEIMSVLGRLRSVRVAARTSSFAFKGERADLATIAETLRVGAVLEGSVRRAGNRVRITAQLTDASTGFQVWSDRYDAEVTDIFALQDQIAESVAGALRPRLEGRGAGVERLTAPSTTRAEVNVSAYESYLRGRLFLDRQVEGIGLAFPHFARAIELDPGFAAAYAGMARAYVVVGVFVAAPLRDALTRAREMAERARTLDPHNPEAVAVLGAAALFLDWDWDAARSLFDAAVALDPGAGASRQYRSIARSIVGHHDAAIADANDLLRLDPLSLAAHRQVVLSAAMAGRASDAVAAAEEALSLEPTNVMLRSGLGLTLTLAGRAGDAVELLRSCATPAVRSAMPQFFLAIALRESGAIEELRALHQQLRDQAPDVWTPSILLAYIHWALGEAGEAGSWMRRSVAERDFWLLLVPHLAVCRPFLDDAEIAPHFAGVSLVRS